MATKAELAAKLATTEEELRRRSRQVERLRNDLALATALAPRPVQRATPTPAPPFVREFLATLKAQARPARRY